MPSQAHPSFYRLTGLTHPKLRSLFFSKSFLDASQAENTSIMFHFVSTFRTSENTSIFFQNAFWDTSYTEKHVGHLQNFPTFKEPRAQKVSRKSHEPESFQARNANLNFPRDSDKREKARGHVILSRICISAGPQLPINRLWRPLR